MRDQMSYYNRLDVGHADRSYEFLVSIVRKHLEMVRGDRTRDELQNSLLRRGRAMAAEDAGGRTRSQTCPRGVCRTWFAKGSCSKGKSCSFSHAKEHKGVGKGKGRSASRGRGKGKGKGGKSRSSSPNQKICPFHLKGDCKKGKDCDMKHNPTCNFWKKDGTCKFGDQCTHPHRDIPAAQRATSAAATGSRRQSRRKRRGSPPGKEEGENPAPAAIAFTLTTVSPKKRVQFSMEKNSIIKYVIPKGNNLSVETKGEGTTYISEKATKKVDVKQLLQDRSL